jgi:flagellar assembly protein FliH
MAQRSVIKAEFAFQEVLRFEPQRLTAATSEGMDELVKAQDHNADFQIAEVVRNFTGLAEIEGQRIENEIEEKALEELKAIQEQAYSEAFDLGMIEGRRQAFTTNSEEIDRRLGELDKLITTIRDLKVHFLNSNENQLIKMVYYLATKMAMFEVSERSNEAIQSVLRECVTATHSEEHLRVIVSPDQIEFLETLQKERKREIEFLKNVEFTPQEGISPGGCIIATNYSEIDARLEERINKLWEEIRDSIPPLKDRVQHG